MEILIGLIILIFSAIFHEVAHGFVADRLGDPTARLKGRLTLNPISHIDPMMSIILPLILLISQLGLPPDQRIIFGAAKPVPIDLYNFKDKRKDMALVALAGPLTNFGLAILAAIILRVLIFVPLFPLVSILYFLLSVIVSYNLLLGIFNLIPIPPLDGSKIFALLLPEKESYVYLSLGSIGMFIIFFLLLFPIGGLSLGNLVFSLLAFSRSLLVP